MNVQTGNIGLIVAILAAFGWIIDAIDTVRSARWFMSTDPAIEIIGFTGFLAGATAVVMIYIALKQKDRTGWLIYGGAATFATLIKLTATTWLGFSQGITVGAILFMAGIVVAFFGYQQSV